MHRIVVISFFMLLSYPLQAGCMRQKLFEMPYVDVVASDGKSLLVGSFGPNCKSVLDANQRPAAPPPGLKVSPEDALAIAVNKAGMSCPGNSHGVVIAREGYYLISVWSYRDTGPVFSFVRLDGISGQLVEPGVPGENNPNRAASGIGATDPCITK
jgi:hypothetical protein